MKKYTKLLQHFVSFKKIVSFFSSSFYFQFQQLFWLFSFILKSACCAQVRRLVSPICLRCCQFARPIAHSYNFKRFPFWPQLLTNRGHFYQVQQRKWIFFPTNHLAKLLVTHRHILSSAEKRGTGGKGASYAALLENGDY